MRKIVHLILLIFLLTACGNHLEPEKHEGTIVSIEETVEEGNPHHGWYYMLVISDVEPADYLDKSEDELTKLAQENDGAIYSVNPDIHEDLDLEIGTQVVLYYHGQGDSNPPVRNTEKIDVIGK